VGGPAVTVANCHAGGQVLVFFYSTSHFSLILDPVTAECLTKDQSTEQFI